MIYPCQQKAIACITRRLQSDASVEALLISGSLAHGFNTEVSDVDINIVVSNETLRQKNCLTFWESAGEFYPDGYFDGKFITMDTLAAIAERGNEPTRFALHDSQIAFDRTGRVEALLRDIGTYPAAGLQERTIRFLSQLDAWYWYCGEAIKKKNHYLLDVSVSKLILFAGRLILLENRLFFPYHKWFLRVLENAEKKPAELIPAIQRLLSDKSGDNIKKLYELVKTYKAWAEGIDYNWVSQFVYDIETVWMRQDDFIENI